MKGGKTVRMDCRRKGYKNTFQCRIKKFVCKKKISEIEGAAKNLFASMSPQTAVLTAGFDMTRAVARRRYC